MRYSVESTVLPTTAPDLLEWAAAHIEARGFHDGHDYERFGHRSGVTATRLLTPGMLGAFDVAAGDGRRSSAHTYDYPAVYAAERLALDVLSDLAAGGAVVHDADWANEERHRRYLVHRWGMDGRTGADAVALFREAAGLADRAAAAATRLGRPPRRLRLATAGPVLEWAAAHIEDVGHRPGDVTHDPAGFTDTSACTMLHALDRALVAAKPCPADGLEAWAAYRDAEAALRLVVEHVAGGPVRGLEGERDWELAQRLRGMVLVWGNVPGRSTAEVAGAFRGAVPADVVGDVAEDPVEPGQAAFF